MLQRDPHKSGASSLVHLVLGASITQAPQRSPLPGWRQDPLGILGEERSTSTRRCQGEGGTFPLPIRRWQCPAPDATYPRGLPESRRSVLEEA